VLESSDNSIDYHFNWWRGGTAALGTAGKTFQLAEANTYHSGRLETWRVTSELPASGKNW